MERLLALIVALFASQAPMAAAQVTELIGEFTGDMRLVSASLNDIEADDYEGNGAALAAVFESTTATGEMRWMLLLYGFSDHPTAMSTAKSFALHADGKRWEPTELDSEVRPLEGGGVIELKTATFTKPVYEHIAAADTVTLTIDKARFTISRAARRDMHTIIDRVELHHAANGQ